MQNYLEPKPTICAMCGETFDASTRNRGKGRQTYCSAKCRTRADNRRHYYKRKAEEPAAQLQRTCAVCGVGFLADVRHPSALTCSQACNMVRMNRVRSVERAKNTDLAPRSCEACGATYTPSHRSAHRQRYCSKACQNRIMQRRHAEKNKRPFDKRLRTAKWKEASKAAIERDGNKCRACGKSDCRLSVHHIWHLTQAEQESCNQDDLLTLCGSCHNEMHDIRLGRQDGKVVITGLVFRLCGITEVTVI